MTTIGQKLSGYDMQDWFDHIYKVNPDGKPIPKRDESGQIIYNPYTGYPEWEAFEEGSRFTAQRMLHIERGIFGAHSGLAKLDRDIKKMRAQLELDGRVPNHNGSFIDAFDGSTQRLTRLTAITELLVPVTSASTVLQVADASKFEAMTFVTIYDVDSYEHVMITAVNASAKTITVTALTSDYSKGAKLARSTANVNTTEQTLDVAPFVTYKVDLVEVV